jgi:hypothetical protein
MEMQFQLNRVDYEVAPQTDEGYHQSEKPYFCLPEPRSLQFQLLASSVQYQQIISAASSSQGLDEQTEADVMHAWHL